MAYALKELFRKELAHAQQQQIIVLLGLDNTSDWCNGFVLVPMPNGTVCLYLDNQALIMSMHKGPIVNNIFPGPRSVHYLSLLLVQDTTA